MSKKNKKKAEQGTYALCITAGLIVGLGLGPLMGNVIISMIVGAGIGTGAAYYINQRQQRRKH